MSDFNLERYIVDDTRDGRSPVNTVARGYTGTFTLQAKTTNLVLLIP